MLASTDEVRVNWTRPHYDKHGECRHIFYVLLIATCLRKSIC